MRTFVFLLFFAVSCNHEKSNLENPNNSELTLHDTFSLPLDTLKIIDMLDINLQGQVSKLNIYKDSLDTVELSHVSFACDCQDWVMDQYWNKEDIGKYGYFIQPYNEEVKLNDEIGAFRNRVRFIGRTYFDNNRSLKTKLSDTIRVFEYYAYEVLSPVQVYGPLYKTGDTEIPGDTEELILPSIITLKD